MASTLASRKAPEVRPRDLGEDNVFADLGVADADERALKATLVSRIRAVIADRKLTQVRAGEIMGLPQPKVSELVSGGATGFGAERLIRLLNTLGVSVSIALREEPEWKPGETFVHFGREPDTDMVAPEEEAEAVDDTAVHRGSGNFLADRGIEDPDEFRVKAHLCNEIASILAVRNLTQEKAAAIVGQKQADLSRIVNSRFDDYSVWRLMKILSALGTDVLIAVNPSSGNHRGVILSQTMELEET